MHDNITLTIGIPTYNGENVIRNALESATKQISSGLEKRVDIFVSDNASTDNTSEVVRSYQTNPLVKIHYSKNETNLGFDRNTDVLFKKAAGKFIWILGDDDVLEDGAISQVLELIDAHPLLKAIQVNFDKYDISLSKVVQRVHIPEDIYCKDAESFLINSKGRWGAVSSLIINREAWAKENFPEGFGSRIAFAYALFKIILHGHSYICSRSLVKVRDGSQHNVKQGDGDALLSIALESGKLYRQMEKMGYSPAVMQPYLREDRNYVYNAISLAKFWGIKNKIGAAKDLCLVHNSLILWARWLPLIFFPDFLFRPLYLLKKQVSSKTRFIENYLKKFLRNFRSR